jgi:hypothetical protein
MKAQSSAVLHLAFVSEASPALNESILQDVRKTHLPKFKR